MKPAQLFQLGCRRTSEAASRLGDWLDHNTAVLGLGHRAVQEDLDGLAQRLHALARAADLPPAIGLVSTDAAAKADLLFGLVASGGQFNVAEFGPRPLDPASLRRLLQAGDTMGGTAVIRFGTGEPASAPRGHPLRIVLLSLTDVAAVMTKAATSALHHSAAPPSAGDVEALFGEVQARLSSQAVPGLSDRDVLELCETLNTLLPGHPTLARLGATRYWSGFREIAAHISDRDRQLLLSLLWGRDKAFSALFERMAEGLAKFGHGGEAYCSTEALVGKDAATGWITRHPRSILHSATLLDLAQPHGATISVVNRFGQAMEIERAVLAGLAAELPLHASGGRLQELAPAEILDFPVPHIISGPAVAAAAGRPANDDLNVAIDHFAKAKALHLVERACLRHDLTSLVTVVDIDGEDDTFGPAIGDWVELAQGATAHARRRVRSGLHVVAIAPAEGRDEIEMASDDPHGRVRRALQGIVGAHETWPAAWTPERPLTAIYWLNRSASPPQWAEQRSAGGLVPSVAAAAVPAADRSVIQDLVQAVKPASEPHVRQVQLNQAFQEIRRRLNDCVMRHHLSNAPSALSDWRRSVALVTQDRIKFLIEQRRLSHLFRALLPAEAELYTAIEASGASRSGQPQGETARWSLASGLMPAQGGAEAPAGDPAWATRMAERALDHWFRSMRRAARSGRLCRGLGIEPRVVQNLADELQLGALRSGLAGEIGHVARTLSQSQGGVDMDTSTARRQLAAIARRLISAYLELPQDRGPGSSGRALRIAGSDGEVAEQGGPQYSFAKGDRRGGAARAGP